MDGFFPSPENILPIHFQDKKMSMPLPISVNDRQSKCTVLDRTARKSDQILQQVVRCMWVT